MGPDKKEKCFSEKSQTPENERIKTVTNAKNQKEVTVKLDNNKTLHILHSDSQTVIINGKPFRRELVNHYLTIHKQQQDKKQQINGKIKDLLLKKKIKQEPTNEPSLLRNRLSKRPEEFLFNENHSNSEGIKFLQNQFKSNPTLQSILAEIATLQKEYNDLDANSLDKEVEAMREKNSLPSMIDLDLFRGKEATIVRPSTSKNGTKPLSNNISSDRLIIDEDSKIQCKIKHTIEKNFVIEPRSPSTSSTSSSISDFKIVEVFANGKKVVSCDRCDYEGPEEEVKRHNLSHFKKAKESRSKLLSGGSVKVKSEPVDYILIDDDD